MKKVTWRCPDFLVSSGDPDENPHTEIVFEGAWPSTEPQLKALEEAAEGLDCACGEPLERTEG